MCSIPDRTTDASHCLTGSYYGSSFIADHRGDLVEQLGRTEEGVIVHAFDLDFLDRHRAAWGFFRDRRLEFYR